MGYDLHLTRVQFWPGSEDDPISLAEFHAAITDRPGWSGQSSLDPTTWPTARTAAFAFDHPTRPQASLPHVIWREGRIDVSKPGDDSIPELVALAESLTPPALVVGDEDEIYRADGTRVPDDE